VRKKKGIIILPHPYHHHQELEYIAKEVYCIEVFNARCSDEQNQRALELCINLGKIPFYGSDSHLYSEIDNVILGYPDSCKDYPFLHAPEVLVKKRTYNYKIRISSFIKAIKTLDFYPGIILIFSIIKWILIEKLLMKYHKVRRKNNDNY